MDDPPRSAAPDCYGCRHHRITHDPAWPHACERFGFRARRPPALEVFAASGERCHGHEPRPATAPAPRPRRGRYA